MLGCLFMGLALIGAAHLVPSKMGLGSNEWVRMKNVNLPVVASALKAYAVTHGNRFPATVAEANRGLLSPGAGLLPGDMLLPSPYGGQQRGLLPLMGPVGGVDHPTSDGKYFPGGGHQSESIEDWDHLGAILYDASSDGKRFVLYGVRHGSVTESLQPWSFGKLIFSEHLIYTATASVASLDGFEAKAHAVFLEQHWQKASRVAQAPYVAMPLKGIPFIYR
ncbi:hypothetical protein D3C86_1240680 [compost metagenome]